MTGLRNERLEAELLEETEDGCCAGGEDGKPEALLGQLDRGKGRHLHARRQNDGVRVADVEAGGDVDELHGIEAPHLEVVRNLEAHDVDDLETGLGQVVDDERGDRLHVGGDERDPRRAQGFDPVDERARAAHDGSRSAVLGGQAMEALLSLPVKAGRLRHQRHEAGVRNRVHTRVGELESAPVAVVDHALQLLLRHGVEAGSARMDGEALGPDLLATTEHLGDLGLHRRVRARDDQTDPGRFHHVRLRRRGCQRARTKDTRASAALDSPRCVRTVASTR